MSKDHRVRKKVNRLKMYTFIKGVTMSDKLNIATDVRVLLS